MHLFTTAEKVHIHSGGEFNFQSPNREQTVLHLPFRLKTTNKSVCSLYLGVETEGFGRFPNAQQIKYDLLHGEIQSLLNRERTNWCYRISEVMWCEAARTSIVYHQRRTDGAFLFHCISSNKSQVFQIMAMGVVTMNS